MTNRPPRKLLVVVLTAVAALQSNIASAGFPGFDASDYDVVYDFIFDFDDPVTVSNTSPLQLDPLGPYQSLGKLGVTVTSEFDAGQNINYDLMTFTIFIDDAYGEDRDIHEFGFNLNSYDPNTSSYVPVDVQLYPDPQNGNPNSGETYIELTNTHRVVKQNAFFSNDSVGAASPTFDYVVSFQKDNPSFKLEPAQFSIAADPLGGNLSIADLTSSSLGQHNNGTLAHFGVHVGSTTTPAGSEAFGGFYNSEIPIDPQGIAPELGTMAMSLSAFLTSAMIWGDGRRRRGPSK